MRQLIQGVSREGEITIVLLSAFGYFILGNALFLLNPMASPPISQQHLEFILVYESITMALVCSLLYVRGWTIKRVGLSPTAREMEQGPSVGFGRYIISATTAFERGDLAELRKDAPAVVGRRVLGYEAEYRRRRWSMLASIDRVYVNERARTQLGWRPRYDFPFVIEKLRADKDFRSPLAIAVGSKGYHG
jgi:hypothetical protein